MGHPKSTFAQDSRVLIPPVHPSLSLFFFQKSSKVNMKSTIGHNFPSPDLLEGLKNEKMKKKMQSLVHSKARFTTLVHLTSNQEVHVIYKQ